MRLKAITSIWGKLAKYAPILAMVSAIPGFLSCAGKPTGPLGPPMPKPTPFDVAPLLGSVEELWSKKLPGLIADMEMAKGGSAIALSTAPDPERGGSYQLQLLKAGNGRLRWARPLQVKALSIAADASLVVSSTHDDEVIGFNGAGKKIWSYKENCRPIIITSLKRIVCFHDDDTQPGSVFDVLNFKGRKLFGFPATSDAMVLKVSDDEKNMAVGLADGRVLLFGADFRVKWQFKVPGEIQDLAVFGGKVNPGVVVLLQRQAKQRLAYLDAHGMIATEELPSFFGEQVEVAPGARGAFLYGNGPRGQYLGFFKLSESPGCERIAGSPGYCRGAKLVEQWGRRDPRFADYSHALLVFKDFAIFGFQDNGEEDGQPSRQSVLLSYSIDGQKKWSVPIAAEEGAYLYGQAFSSQAARMAVSTDDSSLSVYQIGD